MAVARNSFAGRAVSGICGLAAIVVTALYCYLGVNNPLIGFLSDDALYLLMADIFSARQPLELPVYEHIARQTQLPSMFPLVLAMAGAGSESIWPARLVVAISMGLSNLLFYLWQRQMGTPRREAFLLALLVSIHPISLIYVTDLWSESLYACFVWLSLIALHAGCRSQGSRIVLFAAGTAIGCALMTRTIGVALVPAAACLVWRARPGGVVAICSGFFLSLLVLVPLELGGEGESYISLLVNEYTHDPLAKLSSQFALIGVSTWDALGYVLFLWRDYSLLQQLVLVTFLSLVLLGIIDFTRTRHVHVAVYLLAYIAIFAIWPFPAIAERLIFAILPLLLFTAYRGMALATARLERRPEIGGAGFIVALALLASPAMAACASRLVLDVPPPELRAFRTSRYWIDPTRTDVNESGFHYMLGVISATRDVGNRVPETECIYTLLPQMVLFNAKRTAWLPPSEFPDTGSAALECRYYYLTATPLRGQPAFYPYELIKDRTETVAMYQHVVPQDSGSSQPSVTGLLLRYRMAP
jgi:hypothetical protein